jgi:hypothetical protein
MTNFQRFLKRMIEADDLSVADKQAAQKDIDALGLKTTGKKYGDDKKVAVTDAPSVRGAPTQSLDTLATALSTLVGDIDELAKTAESTLQVHKKRAGSLRYVKRPGYDRAAREREADAAADADATSIKGVADFRADARKNIADRKRAPGSR